MRPIALLAAVALALAGCADDDDTAATPGEASASVSASASPTASGTRTVSHIKGETQVPAEPERVVVLDSSILDFTVSLGVTPVGAVRTAVDSELPDYLGERVQDVEIVGEIANPNLEAIAAQQPDLIISSVLRDDALYDQLGDIAPTVMTEGAGTAWRTDFLIVGEALDKEAQAREGLEEFDAAAERVGNEIDAAGVTASIVRFLPDETRVYGPDSFSGSVLAEVGFDAPDLDFDEFSIAYLSTEQIEQADADVIFATTFGPEEDSTRAAVEELWGNLRAIETGCQFDVEDDTWMVGIGLIGAEAILDDVERLLADADADAECGAA